MVLDTSFHIWFIITKCDSYFLTKCDGTLLQNASGFSLQNSTVSWQNAAILLKDATIITYCDAYYKLQQDRVVPFYMAVFNYGGEVGMKKILMGT